jgi:surface protein
MFEDCSNLKQINLSSFENSRSLRYASGMFKNCKSLNELNFSKFDSYNLINVEEMFYGCSNLEELNLSSFSTINAFNISKMFYGCSSLKLLDIRKFNTINIKEKDAYQDIFKFIDDSPLFTLIYNKNKTLEIEGEIKLLWNKIILD